jgi:hypothetical protein
MYHDKMQSDGKTNEAEPWHYIAVCEENQINPSVIWSAQRLRAWWDAHPLEVLAETERHIAERKTADIMRGEAYGL